MIATIRNKQSNKYKAFIDASVTLPVEMCLTDFKLEIFHGDYTLTNKIKTHLTESYLSIAYSSGGESMREYLETQKRYNKEL